LVVAFQVGKDWSKLDAPSVQYTLMLEDGAWNGLSGKCDNHACIGIASSTNP